VELCVLGIHPGANPFLRFRRARILEHQQGKLNTDYAPSDAMPNHDAIVIFENLG
jgi:hypothetical protein